MERKADLTAVRNPGRHMIETVAIDTRGFNRLE